LGTLEYLSDNGRIARIGKIGQTSVYAEVVERGKYRISEPFGSLLVVFGKRKKKCQHLFLGNADQITFAKLGRKSGKNELTCFGGIFFWSWPGDTADGNRLPVNLS
jgi:hypothetical protein